MKYSIFVPLTCPSFCRMRLANLSRVLGIILPPIGRNYHLFANSADWEARHIATVKCHPPSTMAAVTRHSSSMPYSESFLVDEALDGERCIALLPKPPLRTMNKPDLYSHGAMELLPTDLLKMRQTYTNEPQILRIMIEPLCRWRGIDANPIQKWRGITFTVNDRDESLYKSNHHGATVSDRDVKPSSQQALSNSLVCSELKLNYCDQINNAPEETVIVKGENIENKHGFDNEYTVAFVKYANAVKHVKCKHRRDREPSRTPKKLACYIQKRQFRKQFKKMTIREVPKSSHLFKIASHYKVFYLKVVNKQNSFFTAYAFCTKKSASFPLCNVMRSHFFTGSTSQYCVADRKLLISGDIETNPGPMPMCSTQTVSQLSPMGVLEMRLNQQGLHPLDVGGGGDCFFRAVSHQLFSDPSFHLHIRQQGVICLRENPERFIESNYENSWLGYLSNMACSGVWADALIIQAVADRMNLRIHITESHPNFTETTTVEAVGPQQELRTIFLGHLDEMHYVSTLPNLQFYEHDLDQNGVAKGNHIRDSVEIKKNKRSGQISKVAKANNSSSLLGSVAQNRKRTAVNSEEYCLHNNPKQKKIAADTKQSKLTAVEQKLKKAQYQKRYQSKLTNEQKQRKAKYMKEYWSKLTDQKKKKKAEYMKEYQSKLTGQQKVKKAEYLNKYQSKLTDQQKVKKAVYMKEYQSKLTDQQKVKKADYMKQFQSKLTEKQKQKKADYTREYMSTLSTEQKKTKSQYNKEYMKRYRTKQPQVCLDIQEFITRFHDIISKGPVYICSCCDQLWYKHSVSDAAKLRKCRTNVDKYLLGKKSVDNMEWVCNTCEKHLKKNKVPPAASLNGMKFPDKPSFFDLNDLECRLLAPRLAFQKLMQAPRGKQLKINGNIVNVAADVVNSISLLPRLNRDTGTIKINLKRKLQYKSSALSMNVRPFKVVQAAKWLINNSKLYKEEGISFNEAWQHDTTIDALEDKQVEVMNELFQHNNIDCSTSKGANEKPCSNEDDWSEDEAETPAGTTDTMLTATDFLNENERKCILNVAPAEGSKPISVFWDKYAEELAYPGIFLGQKRPENSERLTPVHYSDICKSEIRRSDRRAAMCVENLFFKTKKLQMKLLLGKSQIALRKYKGSKKSLNAGMLKQEGALNRIVHLDEGFKFLRALRGSPPYFEKAKQDIFAMIRQLGPASLFCSFSSAETQWNHLLRILGKLVDNINYTDVQLESFNWEQRCRLIQSDPVTCARHFDYQVNQFIHHFLMSNAAPLGKIADWFYRVEYQQRGSPHIHMLIWVEDAPVFGVDDDVKITDFIDNIISCERPLDNPNLLKLVNRQCHRHSHTCRKRAKAECRFNYPQPPMRVTTILYPLDAETELNHGKKHKDAWISIKKQLNDMKDGEDISFDELLTKLNMTEENYILAIQSSLKSATIFLKRQPNELRINNYNAACLQAWRANMDIQFVLDVYACAMYIVSYISKAQKGMSELLRKACDEARKGNAGIKQQVRDIGNKFLNNVEISAQEAVYILLQLPMRKSSRQVVFINTSPPEDRVNLLKHIDDIKEMEDESEDVFTSGTLKRYSKRPLALENVTLADWAAWYDSYSLQKCFVNQSKQLDIDGLPFETSVGEENDDEDSQASEQKALTKGYKGRRKSRIIRSVFFNKNADPEKHYRELIMLFTPWRNEETDLLGNCSSYYDRYLLLKKKINEQKNQYAICSEDLDDIQNHLNADNEDNGSYDIIAPNTQDTEYQDAAAGMQDLHPDFSEAYDMSHDIGIPSAAVSNNEQQLIHQELQDFEYRQMVQKLNVEQKQFFYHVLNHIKTSDDAIYPFLSGGAGVGKSHVTNALYQAVLKYYNSQAGEDFNDIKVLLLAPTGKAAYNIKGTTIHGSLAIPASQSLRNYKTLDSSRLNTLRCQLGKVKLIFIDEISMVGNTMFNVQINNRLKDIKGSKDDFGGVSIIAIGDLFQLQPVMDGYIFKDLDDLQYGILAPNLWQQHFTMFELQQIMRQRESKEFAEILNRLREGNHTQHDILKIKQRLIKDESQNQNLMEAPHLFIQNSKVNEYNQRVFNAASGKKCTIKAQDSVVGANSAELRDKIMKQIPDDPRKTKQIISQLKLAEGERTELATNIRTEDGMTNGAGNVVKKIFLNQPEKPTGIVWVQFDHAEVGEKTRHDNRHLYKPDIDPGWTPIFPINTHFAVGRTKAAQVIRKQFPLRPAAAKTIHRSQGDTESKVVVNFSTNRAIPHIHYVGLSRVTAIDGLYITELCEDKISVRPDVKAEMERLRLQCRLQVDMCPSTPQPHTLTICILNARSLHRHIDDIRTDLYYKTADLCIFTETRFCSYDSDIAYTLQGYSLFRNDAPSNIHNNRPYGGTAVYSKVQYLPGYPYSCNTNGIELTVTRTSMVPDVTIVSVYRSPQIPVQIMCRALRNLLSSLPLTAYHILLGDFNVNWFNNHERTPLYNLFIQELHYRQIISNATTDNRTCIDHVYTDLNKEALQSQVYESYFSDHKPVCVMLQEIV